ncbi:hypothetical protein FRC04_008035 [Tulasnella sp. 424]|nr:hypothetical protein FRC04_008035 [Tulasnella sp. 424]KAG8959322.1 hypothetical protein FRC05_007905 [Tulasnella sp. 425]
MDRELPLHLEPVGDSDDELPPLEDLPFAKPDDNLDDEPFLPAESVGSSSSSQNRNPKGKNQHPKRLTANDPALRAALKQLHREGETNYGIIKTRLKKDYDIEMGEKTVQRRLHELNLFAAGKTAATMPIQQQRQLVLNELETDPNNRRGPANIKEGILFKHGVALRRDFVHSEMLQHRPEGFDVREPTAKRIPRGTLYALGPHDCWSMDGHDKLTERGFPIYGIRDKWSGQWLGLWVVPNNRVGNVVAYLYLSLVHELGGIPNQTASDRGSETTKVYGLGTALRDIFAGNIAPDDAPAHIYLRSVHNIVIERGWLRLRLEWGDAVAEFYDQGTNLGFVHTDPQHSLLSRWVWSTVVRTSLEIERQKLNSHRVRKVQGKKMPDKGSPNQFMANPIHYGAVNESCLHPVDRSVVKQIMDELGGEALLRFVDPAFDAHCYEVYRQIGSPALEPKGAWGIFLSMLPHINFPEDLQIRDS